MKSVRYGVVLAVIFTAMLYYICAQAQASPVGPAPGIPAAAESTEQVQLAVSSHPQALPNDGRSEAIIEVAVTAAAQPVVGEVVKAKVDAGGGFLLTTQATTDASGVAKFQYRSGLIPEAGRINFTVSNAQTAQLIVIIPLAPMAYIDVELLAPEAYKAHRQRQVSAAPIYRLEVDGFPEQLACDGGSLCSLSAQLTMVDGKPAPGVPLKVDIVSGEGSLQLDKTTTDSSGKIVFYYTAGYTPGTVTLRVTEPSTGLTAVYNIVLVKAGPARIELCYMDPLFPGQAHEGALLPADGITGMPMVAKVTDLLGLPLAGAEIKVELLDSHNGWLEVLDPVSDAQGLVEFTYYSGAQPGKVRLRAYVANGMKLEPVAGLAAIGPI